MIKKEYVRPTAIVEEWKDVVGYEGLYKVSNLGRVKALKKHGVSHDKLVRTYDLRGLGYMSVRLSKNNKAITHKVHRLVAQAFIPNKNRLPQVNHKDENKSNNFVDNLEWCDSSYNINYGTRNDKMASKNSKPVLQFDMKGSLIAKYNSIKEASQTLSLSNTGIIKCCKFIRNSSGGFIWRYA